MQAAASAVEEVCEDAALDPVLVEKVGDVCRGVSFGKGTTRDSTVGRVLDRDARCIQLDGHEAMWVVYASTCAEQDVGLYLCADCCAAVRIGTQCLSKPLSPRSCACMHFDTVYSSQCSFMASG